MAETEKKITVFCLPPQDKPVYFIVHGSWGSGVPGEEGYVVDEHTCPTNLFGRGVEAIIVDGDCDPHGIFRFVRETDTPKWMNRGHCPEDEWPKIVPEAFLSERNRKP